jgi:hypothetical protein
MVYFMLVSALVNVSGARLVSHEAFSCCDLHAGLFVMGPQTWMCSLLWEQALLTFTLCGY